MSRRLLVLALCAIGIVAQFSNDEINGAKNFLQKYGYLNDTATSLATVETSGSLNHAIALFQEYYGLAGKGQLNNATLNLMRQPRCGLPDIPDHPVRQNIRIWPKKHLRWNFHLAQENILKTTRAAFDAWAERSALTFERDSNDPDILLSFAGDAHLNVERRKNGNACPSIFDGRGGILAHAYYPTGDHNYTAEVHVDNAEPWYIFLKKSPSNTRSLLHTLVHEIGHALGLSHSVNQKSIMFAYALGKSFPVELDEEDVLRIRQLYGAEGNGNDPPTTTTTAVTTPKDAETDLCALRRVDSVLVLNERIFVAHGRDVWSIDIEGKTYGKPLTLNDYLRFLPRDLARLSGAYQTPSGDLMLFAGKMIYRVAYPSYELVQGWPISLADFGLPADARINAAVNTNRGRSFVLYNNDLVGEIDDCQMRVVRHNTIQAIFPGIPQGVTSAFRYIDGSLYFLGKRQFYKFNEFTRGVTAAGKMDLQIVGVVCPRNGLLEQIRDLLNRLVRIDSVLANSREEEEEEEKK